MWSAHEIAELDMVYERYGFERQKGTDTVRVYVLRQGYYYGADLILLDDNADAKHLADDWARTGFATQIRSYKSANEAHDSLFAGFFCVKETADRILQDYDAFVNKLSKSLGAKYSFVEAPHTFGDTQISRTPLIPSLLATLRTKGPHLMLIEAAAGFGKTCTAYELARALADSSPLQVSIFAELSRNRQARIFKYVLLDEIDRSHRNIGYELVKAEIQSGRIPLIIDGFDELLRKASPGANEKPGDFEEVESMLDTIGDLLVDNAKIVLTSRRTAVLADDRFQKWADERDFAVSRVGIGEPSIADWLGQRRCDDLVRAGAPISRLANPVLLSHMKALDDARFAAICERPDSLVRIYFSSMLEREQERQNLRLDLESQLAIFRNLARWLADSDLTSETRPGITSAILKTHQPLLERARKTYPVAERPTVDELAETLAGHALLDRSGRDSGLVGFINEFVFGTLLGDSLVIDHTDEWPGTEAMISRAATAYRIQSADKRVALWESMNFASHFIEPTSQFTLDLDLRAAQQRPFNNVTFEGLRVEAATIGGQALSSCTFVKCSFRSCTFDVLGLREVGFLECEFIECSATGSPTETTNWTRGCDDKGSGLLAILEGPLSGAVPDPSDLLAQFTQKILDQFRVPGKLRPKTQRELRSIFALFESKHHKTVLRAIEFLEKSGVVAVRNHSLHLLDGPE